MNDIMDLFDGSDVRVKLYADDIEIYVEITMILIMLHYKVLLTK